MSFDLYDFTESMDRVGINAEDIERCTLAWGRNGEYAEWDGGFVFELKDGRWGLVAGWCDTTGWGCQDGAEVEFFGSRPGMEEIDVQLAKWHWSGEGFARYEPEDIDVDPADVNRYLAGEIDRYGGALR